MIHFLVEHSSVKIGSQVIQCNSCIKVCDIEIESKHCNFEPSYLSLSLRIRINHTVTRFLFLPFKKKVRIDLLNFFRNNRPAIDSDSYYTYYSPGTRLMKDKISIMKIAHETVAYLQGVCLLL